MLWWADAYRGDIPPRATAKVKGTTKAAGRMTNRPSLSSTMPRSNYLFRTDFNMLGVQIWAKVKAVEPKWPSDRSAAYQSEDAVSACYQSGCRSDEKSNPTVSSLPP
jgi:hypothetical protein